MNNIKHTFQVATVFIGTIVGAGLASGQEITQFFTSYGFVGFIGLIICCILYIPIFNIILDIAGKYKLKSYGQFIRTVSPNTLGKITDWIMAFFMLTGAAIILAGSGALLKQFFDIPVWIGILVMAALALIFLLNNTKGIIVANSFIVPSLIIVIVSIFVLHIFMLGNTIDFNSIVTTQSYRTETIPFQWIGATLLYAGFNALSCSGVIIPLAHERRSKSTLMLGIIIGAIVLTMLSLMINLMITINLPDILAYDIPLLHISSHFTNVIQIALLIIIWLEMFSTELSNVYSLSKTLEDRFGFAYDHCVIYILLAAIPLSLIGFKTLITILYPIFGFISLIFIVQCFIFKYKHEI